MFDCDAYNLKRFAFVLNHLRKTYGMTQKELAKAADCKQFDITRYENAKMYPQNDEMLDRLGKAVGMDPYYLKYGMSTLGGNSVRETPYGKEIEMHHFNVDYEPKYVAGKIPSMIRKQELASDDKKFGKLIQDFLVQLPLDDRIIVLELVSLLYMLQDEEYVKQLETSQKNWEDSIDRRRKTFPEWLVDKIDLFDASDKDGK